MQRRISIAVLFLFSLTLTLPVSAHAVDGELVAEQPPIRAFTLLSELWAGVVSVFERIGPLIDPAGAQDPPSTSAPEVTTVAQVSNPGS